ncbi:DUF1761 domain-containing protein [Oricola thermophila]|uniref:DUF1761 domain-containing protein n=1 Tax=Oricola thermophila TaxID=2742145 RepID=A0A6N1VA47_9HYPH|nr:DUF1761 domain-containing protein [Oricola thermophila]QKV17393.1 DUF1761 domain-containing protein [Oricola thermophila]
MEEISMGVSWLAVIAGAVVAFLAGWLWYSPMLFGRTWASGHGIELGTAQSMPFGAMAAQFVGLLLLAWFVGVALSGGGLLVLVLAFAAFCVLAASGGMFTKKPGAVIAIEAGYWIVAAIIMYVAHAIF